MAICILYNDYMHAKVIIICLCNYLSQNNVRTAIYMSGYVFLDSNFFLIFAI
jgi:hypothetical protein